jgi:hypothetical protein
MKHFNYNNNWFKENRLTFLADGDANPNNAANNNVEQPEAANNNKEKPEEPKKSKHDEKQEKIDSEKKRIEDLEKDIEKSNFTTETKRLAKNALQSGDEDEIALVERLCKNSTSFNQSDFKKKLNELREKKKQNKEDPRSYVQSNVNDILLDKMSKQNPDDDKKKEKFHEAVGQLRALNTAEKELRASIDQKLEKHVKSGEITKENVEKIGSMSPDSGILRERIKELLGPKLSQDGALLQYILDQKKKQAVIYKKFETTWEVADALLRESMKPVEIAKKKHRRMNFLKRLTGINLKEGLVLDYIATGANNQPVRKKTTIEKIDFITHELEFLNPGDIDEEYAKVLEKEKSELPNTLRIKISFTAPNGERVIRELDEKKFLLWVNQNQAVEVIKTVKDLERTIGFTDYDQKIEKGLKLDYIAGKTANSNPLIKTVHVAKIDEQNETIELSEEVPIMLHTERHELDSVSSRRMKKVLTFGEFARWFTSTRAEQSMDLKTCREYLGKHPKVLTNRYKDIDDSIWDFNELPIEVTKGEELIVGNNKKMKIVDVNDNEIKLDSGISLTPGQFFRFVKEHEVEKASRVPSKDEIHQKLQDAIQTEQSDDPNKSEMAGQSAESVGLLYGIWKGTQLLSLKDIWTLYKTTEEYLKRRHERNVKKRAGAYGQSLPGRWGAEFRNLAESAEHEEVNKYKEEMEDLDIWIIKDRLHDTSDPDEAKAACLILTGKGLLNFEDEKVWATMNRIMKKTLSISDYEKYYIAGKKVENKNGEKGADALITAINQVWGAPTGSDWYSQNDSAFSSGVDSFTQDATDYENQYKGHSVAAELHNMLLRHKAGDYVNPHRYESFIRFIIEAGKAEIEDKVYYLVAGITEKDPNGETILTKQRHAAIEGKYLNQLPLLDYFTRYSPEGSTEKFPQEYAEELMSMWGVKSSKNTNDGAQRYNKDAVRKFIWQKMMTHDQVLRRLAKGSRRAEGMDHDDAHLLIPMADEDLIYQSIVSNARGQQSNFTQEGLANGIAGYTHYMMSLADNADSSAEIRRKMKAEGFKDPGELMKKTIGSFIAFESVVNKRNMYSQPYLRLGPNHMDNFPIVDGAKTTREHMNEMKRVVHKILTAYGMPESDIQEYLYNSYWDSDDATKKKHEQFLKGFGKKFNQLIDSQGTDKLIQIVIDAKRSGSLNGFEGEDMTSNQEEQQKRADANEALGDDDMMAAAA